MKTEITEIFLKLVRMGVGTDHLASTPAHIDWTEIKKLADKHRLTAIVLDAADKLQPNSTNEIPLHMKLEWIGEVLQNYEQRYALYEKAISLLAGFYNQHGYKMMVLKGYACSLDWPKPTHRPCGDIDIWLFGQQKAADKALVSSFRVQNPSFKIDVSHHHHTVFEWNGFSVENHYDFINVHHHKSNVKFEQILKKLGEDDSHYVELSGERVYLPSPNLHALFLLKHMMLHFSTGEMTLRQLLDWGFFVKAHGKEIDWEWLDGVLDDFGMTSLYNVFNAICVGDLGFDVNIFPKVQFDPQLKDRVLNDILAPEFDENMPSGLLKRLSWKWRRWKANEWKHELCYKESMWSAFWSGVWGHLLKPKSI